MENIAIIYTITNLINGKIYVGSTINALWSRRSSHYNSLRKNKHPNILLQRAYNKYGENNLILEVLDTTFKGLHNSLELYWINQLNTLNKSYGYNILIPNKGRLNIKHSQESKDKISISHFGKIISENTRSKMKIAAKERMDNYPNILKVMKERPSDERIKRMYEATYKSVLKFDLNENFIEEYISVSDAARKNNADPGNISKCCQNKVKTVKNFIWKFKKN